ncbi:MAG: heme NO-binding domain-containing protein [Raineya sp.]|nr:heme NO-binding domain-containing protein [Raineya sp.]MDW8295965.1 heme NO-binding domain-containing protein [Raineya sp.]
MHGTIHYCLEETIIHKYGKDKWGDCLEAIKLPRNYSFISHLREDIDEMLTINFILKAAEVLGISLQQLFDDFAMYWCLEYAPKLYSGFYIGCNTTKDMVLKLSKIHEMFGQIRQGALPPQFEYKELAPNKYEVTYISKRNLFDLYISLVKGLDAYFNNQTQIEKISDNKAILTFSHY